VRQEGISSLNIHPVTGEGNNHRDLAGRLLLFGSAIHSFIHSFMHSCIHSFIGDIIVLPEPRAGRPKAHSDTQDEGLTRSHRGHAGPPGRRVRRDGGVRGNAGRRGTEEAGPVHARYAAR